MKRTAKIFVGLLLLFAGGAFADLTNPLTFSCYAPADVYICDIEQVTTQKANTYKTWGSFLTAFQERIEGALDISKNPSAKTTFSGFEIHFASDIDLGGYNKTNGACKDASFAPMNFGPLAFQPTIDGENHIIKNFCYIAEDKNASFFSSLSNSTVKNVTFLNAYVKAKTVSAGNSCGSLCDAAVVTNTAEQVAFENVAVKGASVYGWQTSTLAVTAKAVSTDLNTPAISLSHVTIQDVNLSMTRDVIAEYSDAEYRYDSQSASGGVVANLRGHFKMDDSLKVLNLSAPDSISKVFKDVTNKEYVGNRYVGGIAGYFAPSADDADFDLDSIEVSAALSGLWVGGLFGKIYINTQPTSVYDVMIEGSSSFKVKDSKVTLNSPFYLGGNLGKNNDKNRYFGGLVGELIWWKGPVLLLNNTVDVSADWHGDKEYSNAVYMGGLVGLVTGGKEVSVVDVSAENDTVTAEMRTSSKSVYAGGILGRVGLETDDNGISGNVRISASRVKAKESNLITTTASEIITVNASYLVGNAVSRGGVFEIQRNHSEGNVNINNDMLSASGAVGAEIGLGWSSGAYIYNNTSVGNLLVKKVIGNTMSLRITQGYVAGRLTCEDPDSKIKLGNNIHYGTSDIGVFRAVDTLKIAGQAHNASTWNKTYSSSVDVRYNYRNALKGDSALAADGSLKKNGSGEIIVNKNTGDSWYNGVIDADAMKTRLFTYVMNATQPTGAYATSWENDDDGDLKISKTRTAYQLKIKLDQVYDKLTDADKESLEGYLDDQGECLYAYTEKDGHLSQDFVDKMKSLSVGYGLVQGSSVFDLKTTMTEDNVATAVLNKTIKVVYEKQTQSGMKISYSPLEKEYDYFVYVWPKVEEVSLFNTTGVVPLVDNGGTVRLYLSAVYVCDDEENCQNPYPQTPHVFSNSTMDFESVVEPVRGYLANSSSKTLHLVYASFNQDSNLNFPTIMFENESKDYPVTVSGIVKGVYAEGEATLRRKSEIQPKKSSDQNVMYSSYEINTIPGYRLKSWDVELTLNGATVPVLSVTLDSNELLDLNDVLMAAAEARRSSQLQSTFPVMAYRAKVTPVIEAIQYEVTFDVNPGEHSVFITKDWPDTNVFSRESGKSTLPYLYSTDACFEGWNDTKEINEGCSYAVDERLLGEVNTTGDKMNLVAHWKTCSNPPVLTKMNLVVQNNEGVKGEYGTISLRQEYKGFASENATKISHEFKNSEMQIPVADGKSMTFHVSSAPKEGYALARINLEIKVNEGTDEEKTTVRFLHDDTVFTITPKSGMSYTLYAVFGGYIFVSLNQDRKDVFHGVNSSTDDPVQVVKGGTTILPAWIYTVDECVLGWYKKAGNGSYVRDVVDNEILLNVLDGDKDLYAVWGDAAACVAEAGYSRLTLESKNGDVQFIEADGKGSMLMHSFGSDNTMLLPDMKQNPGWKVHGAPRKGYALDSLVFDVGAEHFSLREGDSLPGNMNGELVAKAYFSKPKNPAVPDSFEYDSLQFVRREFQQSGNAVRLILETNDFNVKQAAELQVFLMDSLDVVLDSTPAVEIGETPYKYPWTKYPLVPGTYKLKATLDDGREETSFDTSFTVGAEIAVAPNTWQMVSLSDVDESAIVWDDDQAFYYWDESAEYGVIWKYQKYDGGVVNPQQGVWYNSSEGRPLVLRKDAATGSNVAQGTHEVVWKLERGWNMVANPYGWNVSLDRDFDEMYKWSAETGFGKVSGLAPYEAVWLRSDTTGTVRFEAVPFDVAVNAKGLQKTALAKATRENWTLQAVLEDTKGHRDSWNVLGVGEAKEWEEPPAGMGDYVNLSVVEGKKALLKSIKSADEDRYEWNLALSATTDRVGYLKFEGVDALNEMGLRVYVTIDDKIAEMVAGDSLRVLLKAEGSTATVQVTSSEVRTVASNLENLRFARLPGALQVGFDVSSDLAGAGYQVQLVDLKGQVAASYRGKASEGHNTLALTAPKPGLYLLRVSLGRHHAIRKVAVH
ncbi:hypothetical protein SAMN05720487_1298 [Fibrobacter sp. UWT2]|uniref:hypothetical protein n=1 Tax=Fibrobacter sp. UWT2 TaxID=1896224 RepID=UPI00091A5756|nr:hypothetical protein [Fibrobacter sp. UWT2]SHL80579.1 hypothetical protein SAMN05720487_1298 [Fibrobacter sp. UWT2]